MFDVIHLRFKLFLSVYNSNLWPKWSLLVRFREKRWESLLLLNYSCSLLIRFFYFRCKSIQPKLSYLCSSSGVGLHSCWESSLLLNINDQLLILKSNLSDVLFIYGVDAVLRPINLFKIISLTLKSFSILFICIMCLDWSCYYWAHACPAKERRCWCQQRWPLEGFDGT